MNAAADQTKPRSPGAGPLAGRRGAMLLGLALAALVGVAQETDRAGITGVLAPLERASLDWRFRHARLFAPLVSRDIVHVDIDDKALEEHGKWSSWRRERLAGVIDLIKDAGAKAIVLDLVFEDAELPDWRRSGANSFEQVSHDALLADAIRRAGNVIIASDFSDAAMAAKRAPKYYDPKLAGREAYTAALKGKAPPRHAGASELQGRLAFIPPIPLLAAAAERLGFVSVSATPGAAAGVEELLASQPADGIDVPQIGIAGAAAFLGVAPDDLRFEANRVVIGDRTFPSPEGRIFVPWVMPDGAAPEAPSNTPVWFRINEHVPIGEALRLANERAAWRKLVTKLAGRAIQGDPTEKDVAAARDQFEFMAGDYEGQNLASLAQSLEASNKPADREEADKLNMLASWQSLAAVMIPSEPLPPPAPGQPSLEKWGDRMGDWRSKLGGKLVFLGWIATASEADFYPTPLGARTPGVMAHAAIANGILTGFSKVRAPWWAGLGATLILGAGCAWLATRLSPTKSWLAATGLAGGYAALSIVGLFDRAGIVVELAAPLLGGAVAWAGATAAEAVRASRERAAIKRQFRSRVSAQLVDYLADNPQLMNMEGEERELTCVFTDFAGFTSLSEKLEGKQTVALLNRYLRAMTDVLLARGAYVNKFLGDGAMAFWGAPGIDPRHAGRCAAAMLDVIDEVEKLNAETLKAGLTRLDVRVGIATGRVVVGDCGAPPTLNDYTVIGDAVNLASRLESANKLLGTRILLSGRTLELMTPDERAALLLRPLGLVRVVGQSKPTEVFELVGRTNDGTPDERRELAEWIERTRTALELFRAGEYQKSMELWQELILFERGHAGAVLYVQRCAELIETGVRDEVLPLRSK